ncbi:uncharacterized protein LOC118439501 [Folsomia candida]|uniref:uncharacterized protein LOC118439501 n=1 Tax=Folsomia candida TaxID=158441 RepID=UPI001604CBF3|nr:uncharacterized protein LOC118439501 [Folsomia candida]
MQLSTYLQLSSCCNNTQFSEHLPERPDISDTNTYTFLKFDVQFYIHNYSQFSIMEQALSNHLILEKIMEQFVRSGNTGLKNLRLVSPDWNDAVVSLRDENLVLNVNPDIKPCGAGPFIDPSLYLKMHPKLIRSIHYNLHSCLYPGNLEVFGRFVSQLGDRIEHLSLLISTDLGHILHTFFLTGNLPNLKELVVTIDDKKTHWNNWKAMEQLGVSSPIVTAIVPAKRRLTKIVYNVQFKSAHTTTSTPEQHIFLQQMLNAAPNLEQLEIRDDYFSAPLRRFDYLKRFKFVLTYSTKGDIDVTCFQNLTQFLEKVKVSLEQLELNTSITGVF